MNLAVVLAGQGRLAEAEEQLLAAAAAYPDHAGPASSLGLLLVEMERPEEAVVWLERATASEHLVKDHPKTPDVATAVQSVRLAAHLLRRHIGRSTRVLTSKATLNTLMDCQPEIRNVSFSLRIQEDIAGL